MPGEEPISALVDSLLDEPALVFGSLPPAGRDLDLLVRRAAQPSLAGELQRRGFAQVGGVCARFRDCSAQVVELVAAESWRLPSAELEALFAEAKPLPGCERLSRPAPHHALLIVARRAMRDGGSHRAKIEAALAEDGQALARARQRAAAWGASRSLAALERAHRSGRRASALTRMRSVAADLRADGAGLPGAGVEALRTVLRRPRRGAVVAFSGLDGAGKSTQVAALREALERLGFKAVAEWPAIDAPSAWLSAVARAGKAVLAAPGRLRRRSAVTEAGPSDRGKAIRQGSRPLTFLWSMVVALRGAYRLARGTWPHILRGRIVVCDRYVLDSWVYLLRQYGDGRSYALQLWILRLASPRPLRAFLLDLSPVAATRRQPERTVEENAHRARLYRERYERLGLRRLDAARPPEELCAVVAEEVWRSLV